MTEVLLSGFILFGIITWIITGLCRQNNDLRKSNNELLEANYRLLNKTILIDK